MEKEAIDAFVSGDLWDDAKRVAVNGKWKEYFANAYANHLKSKGKVDDLVSLDLQSALQIYVQRGEWQKCLQAVQGVIKS